MKLARRLVLQLALLVSYSTLRQSGYLLGAPNSVVTHYMDTVSSTSIAARLSYRI